MAAFSLDKKLLMERLDVMRFPLVAAIVLIHSYSTTFAEMKPAAAFVRNFFSYGLASVAVPAFFFISGFLFFYEVEWSRPAFIKKVKTRFRTILIPYLFWNLAALTYMLYLQGVPRPNTAQFWYIQELAALILISPIFHLLHKNRVVSFVFLGLFLIIWMFFDWNNRLFPFFGNAMPILFFYAGSVIAVRKINPFALDKYGKKLGITLTAVCVLLFAADTLIKPPGVQLHDTGIITGLFAALFLSRFLVKDRVKPAFLWLGSASFFIFAFHQPLLGTQLEKVISMRMPANDLEMLAYYFSAPVIVTGIGLLVFKLLSTGAPRFTDVITGGRSDRKLLQKEPSSSQPEVKTGNPPATP